MTKEELMFFKSELEEFSKEILIVDMSIQNEYQYLIGYFNNDSLFTFGVSGNKDYREKRFFVRVYDTDFKTFNKLVSIISCFLDEKPIEFTEVDERQYVYTWSNINQKIELQQINEQKKL